MGQYYMPILINEKNERRVYDRDVNGEYTMAKLTEHSWYDNVMVNAICELLYHNRQKVAWVGDYADDFELYDEVWGNGVELRGLNVDTSDPDKMFNLNGKYLVNHSKKEYVDCGLFVSRSTDDANDCMHPLPLLTCVGNGNGGGDYNGTDIEYAGYWCMDNISVEDEIPEGYCLLDCQFREEF